MNDLSEIKKVSLNDLKSFLAEDHTSFSVLSLSAKHIQSTERLSITLSKNSAQSFYLGQKKPTSAPLPKTNCPCSPTTYCNNCWVFDNQGNLIDYKNQPKPQPTDDCLTDPQNCLYFNFFNSKEKKLYTRFLDKVEANFEGSVVNTPLLFLTLTFNTTDQDYHAWTTNWDKEDSCWNRLNQKEAYLKPWAQNFDPEAEPLKVHLPKLEAEVSQYPIALYYLQLFLRRIRRLWKPDNWKWVVVAELQKKKANNPGNWHFHLLSTPIVPYSHKCVLDKNFKPCWNCCAYLSKVWPYGRIDLRSPGDKPISQYLAKYLSKSFHLRQLYAEHGLKEHNKSYRFFKNLYRYETKEAILNGKSKIDKLTREYLNNQQQVFRHYDYQTQTTTHFYKTNETLIGKCSQPTLIKKNYRLGIRSLNPLNLLKIAQQSKHKPAFLLKKPPNQSTIIQHTEHFRDFQEFLITNLLLFCKSAEFIQLPLEQTQVSKLKKRCDRTISNHFKTKPILHFTFKPETVPLVLAFLNSLDYHADYYDMEESKDFLDSRFADPTESRNAYLNHWQLNYHQEGRTTM